MNAFVLREIATALKGRNACPDEVVAVFTKFQYRNDNLPAVEEWARKVFVFR